MNLTRMTWIGLMLFLSPTLFSQEDIELNEDSEIQKATDFNGFVRGGFYTGTNHANGNKPFVSSAFSDFGLKVDLENGVNFKAFTDLRFRYGAEFLEPVKSFDVREAYIKVYGKRWDLSVGEKIIKWGRADFTNPTSKLNPQNLISRSPDREDMDMGNLVSIVNWYPTDKITLEAVAIPYYRSSVLIIDPVPLPDNVVINQISSLVTGKEVFSYGLKADFHLQGIDFGLSWFDGYDPMPGAALSGFNLDMTQPVPVPATEITFKPYKTRVAGLDFETSAGNLGIRGESALSVPYISYKTSEYVPWPEIKWVAGADWSSGIWRFTAEYSGKNIPGFTPTTVAPVIGTEPDYSMLAALLATPGFDLEGYVREQVGAFNRLYNYQLEKSYHSAGIRIESDLFYGVLTPSLFTMLNFTSHDLIVIPELKYKPSDSLTITAGTEFYSGRRNSLYDLIHEFMNSFYFALKIDF